MRVFEVTHVIDPKILKGVLFLLPLVNTDGFHAKAGFQQSHGWYNQNRVYPIIPNGTISSELPTWYYSPSSSPNPSI